MYQILMRLNRYGAIALALTWFLANVSQATQSWLSLDSLSGVQVFVTVLAAMVIADKPLARLSFEEVSRELADISLEEATEEFWQEERQRRRDQDRRD
jgi:hypothetical protein